MPALKSLIGNGTHFIGCSGQTVYVFNKNGEEIARFRDLVYAYNAKISPKNDIFVVKTTDGRMAVYSLTKMALIKKFRYSKVDGAQDDTFCFSPDGKELYNIERHISSCKSALSVYDTKDFSLKKRLLLDDTDINPGVIEYDSEDGYFYIMCAVRGKNKVFSEYFIAKLINDELCDKVYISANDYYNYSKYKGYQDDGYTEIKENLPDADFAKEFFSDINFSKLTLKKLATKHH